MALNITLTAVNSLIAILTMPLLVNLSLGWFMESGQAIPLQFAKVLQVFAIVLLPVALGMLIRHWAPGFAGRMEKPMKIVAALFLAFTIVLALAKDWQTVVEYAPIVGGAALLFNLLSLGWATGCRGCLTSPGARRSPSAWRSASTTVPWPLPWR